MAVWSYFELSNLVEEIVPRELPKLRERASWAKNERVMKIHAAIVKGANENGVGLDPDAVSVTEEDGAIWVRINAAYPIIRIRNETYLSIPISTAHSFAIP
jgi:hypothetical protein